ncbi:MAG: L,D-transpeptidase family protein [Rhodothermales bacterium]
MAPRLLVLLSLVLLAGCQLENRSADRPDAPPVTNADAEVSVYGDSDRTPTDADVEAGRRDTSWRGFAGREADYAVDTAQPDSMRAPQPAAPRPTRADTAAYAEALAVPLSADTDGRAVLYAQILLDRARFSPGQIDGRWGQNTEKAVYWLQRREGLDASGTLDRPTLQRLVQLADAPRSPDSLLVLRTLTEDDVEGPFEEIPDDIYAKAEMERLTYQSVGEKLGEAYHVAPSLLREWRGGALDGLAAGDTLRVPNLRPPTFEAEIDRLVVSDGGRYLHALDAQGRILAHFPSTLGSDYDPSPSETQEIVSITDYPGWHYQPDILADVDDSEEDAHIPPGPNNAVGVVWMELSKEHYGIHGTAYPETIGHTASAGCVRLTNWDAQTLAKHVEPGIEVAFRGTDGRGEQATSADSTAAPRSRP